MRRYDTAVKCGQIKNLIEDNQYLKAMEEIESMDFEKIPSIADLYLFADIFLRAEKMDVAKDLYYTVYHRTASRPALYRLLMLMIRMGDVEEAKDLYLTYEIVAGVTLDTYELRYRLAKAEGEPGTKLIEILEQLKEDEYTEEWGFQLAKLYEMEGMREKCIEECEDLERWFGTGTVVEKARELKQRCMSPSWVKPTDVKIPEPELPDMEERIPAFAHGPVRVEEILPEQESGGQEDTEAETARETKSLESVQTVQETVQTQEAEMLPEETEEQKTDLAEDKSGEEDAYDVQEGVSDDKMAEEEAAGEPEAKPGLFHRIVDYFRVDLDQFDEEEEEFPEELDTYKQQSTAEINVKAILAEGVDDILEETVSVPETASVTETEVLEETVSTSEAEALEVQSSSGHTEPQSLEEQLQEMEENRKVINLEDTMNLGEVHIKSHPLGNSSSAENYEDISRNGLSYGTLKGTISKLQNHDGIINFALTGGTEGISLVVAKRLFKELKKINYFEAKNMLKIMADKLAEVDLEERVLEFIGGCIYIMDAPSLSSESVENLNRLMEKYSGQFVIMLEGSYDEMDSFLSFHKEFEKKITFKVKL